MQAQVVQGADGGMAVKVQQTKLPEFWGQKDKDSITANKFVKRVDKMMSANNWSNKIAFDNFGLALSGSQTLGWMPRSPPRRLLGIKDTAAKSKFHNFIHQPSDLYKLETSFIHHPEEHTVILILHVPYVETENLLPL